MMKKSTARDYLHSTGISVADNVSAMLAYWDKNLVCRFANSSYREWFGKTPEQMVNKITLPELLGPLYEKNLPYIAEALKGNAQTFEREIPLPSGGTRHTLANYFPYAINGEVKGFFVHVNDVSYLKQHENDLLQQIETVNDQNMLLLNFSSILSKDLTCYQKSLDGILENISNRTAQQNLEEIAFGLKKISGGFKQAVNNLQQVVKAQNIDKLDPGYINLHNCINNAIKELIDEIKTTQPSIRNNVSQSVKLFASEGYLQNILSNLLRNCIANRHPDRSLVVDLDTLLMDKELILRIKDNGTGTNLVEMDVAFLEQPYGPGDSRANVNVALFITKFQIESMGGRIKTTCKEDIGTVYNIYFKLV